MTGRLAVKARFCTLGLVLAASVAALILTPAVALAAPSFDVVYADDFVGGSVSRDGSTVTYSRASAEAGTGVYDVETRQNQTIINGTDGVSFPAISGDGSTVHGFYSSGLDSLYEFSGGVRTDVQPAPYVPTALSYDGSVAAANVGFTAVRVTSGFNGTTEPLGDLAGGATRSFASDVSSDGSILIGDSDSAAGTEAFRWEGGAIAGLGDLGGGIFASAARAESGDGSTIVG